MALADEVQLAFLSPQTFDNIWISKISALIVLDEGYSRDASCILNMILHTTDHGYDIRIISRQIQRHPTILHPGTPWILI